jgi:hypothetical protein
MVQRSEELKVECEYTFDGYWEHVGEGHTCYMKTHVVIDSPKMSLRTERDESFYGITMKNNKNVKFLLVDVWKHSPNLQGLDAGLCAISSISKENFRNLHNLKTLWLGHNSIERIDDNVFEDLTSLSHLRMGKKLKRL